VKARCHLRSDLLGVSIATWARINARSYEEALVLLEQLSHLPSTLVQDEHTWSIYVSAAAAELPAVIYGVGVDPSRVSMVGDRDEYVPLPAEREHARHG
jgi:hypothetical protein